MKFSIVTACFNAARTVEETLRSVHGQTGVEIEYIVVHGASTDGTAEIIRRFAPQLAAFVSEPDRGQVDALNKGFARATGEVLGFLNADDVLLPGALEKVAAQFASAPGADLVYGGVEWIDLEGQPLGSHMGNISSLEEILDVFSVWWGERQWVQPEVFFRRELKSRVGAFDERYHLAFDYDFWVRCFLAGATPSQVPAPMVRFRRHAAQKSTDARRAVKEILAILSEHLATNPPIGRGKIRELRARLDYTLYQGLPVGQRTSFASALLQHPGWLLSPEVRQRILASIFKSRAASAGRESLPEQ
jgi:glycosyltransferase involved in cell wall biosynthesis